ncbi:methyltransferase [Persicitalea jodogahamensis]|uniref:Methyltransferase n=2 Tax=Persicitalea jodogahamensis TaxID=402147 RepID=A0A8J3G858_9BACT|nr:SAM-dependent methyltransferase [Persicitalea jodogahamensis]GHB53768.1 methyltransferase [Persicitalea jodogahamensis]
MTEINQYIKSSLADNTFIKAQFSDYRGEEEDLKSLYLKKVIVKRQEKVSFLYRYRTKDITKNYPPEEAVQRLGTLVAENGFRSGQLFTLEQDVQLSFIKGKGFSLKTTPPSLHELPSLAHDKPKNRKIEAQGKNYLTELGITDAQGKVYKNAQDKYKQINHYIEILSSLLKNLPDQPVTNIVDMGAGKGYLTFALYDYLNNVLGKPARVTGVEFRKDLVDLCNTIAQRSGFDALQFEEGTIENYQPEKEINVLIALHACDTATDEAIYQGITANADLIVVAPCCHKQIRREMEKHKPENELDFLIRHGIFLERQAEMVTDGIRSLILEYYGYATKVFEFVSDAHTPKNVLIVGEKRKQKPAEQEMILEKLRTSKQFFGIGYHQLERLIGLPD